MLMKNAKIPAIKNSLKNPRRNSPTDFEPESKYWISPPDLVRGGVLGGLRGWFGGSWGGRGVVGVLGGPLGGLLGAMLLVFPLRRETKLSGSARYRAFLLFRVWPDMKMLNHCVARCSESFALSIFQVTCTLDEQQQNQQTQNKNSLFPF
jgi:hypothetical protein